MRAKVHSETPVRKNEVPVVAPSWLLAFAFLLLWPMQAYSQPGHETSRIAYLATSGNAVLDQRITDLITRNLNRDIKLSTLTENQLPLLENEPVIAVGPGAFNRVRQGNRNASVVAILVDTQFISGYAGKSDGRISAVLYDVPLLRQALTGKAILPQATKVAMLASSEDDELYEPLLGQLADYNLEGRVFVASSKDQLIPPLVRALNYGDFLLGGPDDDIFNPRNIKHILLTAYRRNKILIGPNQAYVKAGALASSYAPFPAMAEKAANYLEQYLETGKFPAPAYPDTYSVEVNQQVARSLNIPLPDREWVANAVEELLKQPVQESVK